MDVEKSEYCKKRCDCGLNEKTNNSKKNTQDDYNYIECPDFKCNVWFQEDSTEKLCKEQCSGKPKLYIKCFNCGKKLYRELLSSRWARIDCECGACNFQGMSGKYYRIDINKTKDK